MFDHRDDEALTVVSLSTDMPPAPERREHSRKLSILKGAILRSIGGEELCLVRNISRAGLMAHIFSEPSVGDPVKIAFRSSKVVRGRVVWRRPEVIGVKFSRLIDVGDVLAEAAGPKGHVVRPIRVSVDAPARLRSGARTQTVSLCNISQGGARIRLGEPHRVGDEVILSVSGLPTLTGTVRWHIDEFAGVAFHDLIAFEDVGRWVASHNAGMRTGRLST